MKTKQLYYQSPYQKEVGCRVLSVEQDDNLDNVILDQTIFYPEGGGQPSDRGTIGEVKVKYVRTLSDEIIHQCQGKLKKGNYLKAALDWNWRYKYMRIHSGGHLLHDVLMTMVKGLAPIRGGHGKKAFLEYQGKLDSSLKEKIEQEANKILQRDLPIVTGESTFGQLQRECKFLPANLPKNKPLRIIKIGDYPPMPDGGIHVKTTKEIGKIWIANISRIENRVNIRYGVRHNGSE